MTNLELEQNAKDFLHCLKKATPNQRCLWVDYFFIHLHEFTDIEFLESAKYQLEDIIRREMRI